MTTHDTAGALARPWTLEERLEYTRKRLAEITPRVKELAGLAADRRALLEVIERELEPLGREHVDLQNEIARIECELEERADDVGL